MALYIFIGLAIWIIGGVLAFGFAEDANRAYHARYVAPYLPISEWEMMSLEEFQLAAELAEAAGTIEGVSTDDVWTYLGRHRRRMGLDAAWEYEEHYLLPLQNEWNRKPYYASLV